MQPLPKGLAIIAAGFAVAACSLFRPPPPEQAPPAPVSQAPAPAPQLPTPVALERFVLKGPNDDVVGRVQRTTIGKQDTLSDVARRFDLGYDEVTLANPGVDPWLPGVGRVVVVPTQFVLPQAPHRGVVINLAAMRIFYFPPRKRHEPQIVYTHPIGIGRIAWTTPEGTTRIIGRQKDPVWIVPKSIRAEHAKEGDPLPAVVPAGDDNPLGKYLFQLGWPGYLIHGTDKPYGVGMRVSHGCMHLYPEDIKQFFKMIPIGTKVTVVNQPYVFGWRDGRLYMQSFQPLKGYRRQDWTKERRMLLARALHSATGKAAIRRGLRIDWQRVIALVRVPRGVPVAIAQHDPGLDAIIAQAPVVADVVPMGSNWNGVDELSISTKTYDELTGSGSKSDSAPAAVTPASVQ
jgi:L,D-transpeptidase ErfK/SrfK